MGLPIFWVDQKQNSYRAGKRKLKIYCSKRKKKSGLILDIAASNLVRYMRTRPSLLVAVRDSGSRLLGWSKAGGVTLKLLAFIKSRK